MHRLILHHNQRFSIVSIYKLKNIYKSAHFYSQNTKFNKKIAYPVRQSLRKNVSVLFTAVEIINFSERIVKAPILARLQSFPSLLDCLTYVWHVYPMQTGSNVPIIHNTAGAGGRN